MTSSIEPEFDLDEDLFGFEPILESSAMDDVDLDSIFNEFESLEREELLQQEQGEEEEAAPITQEEVRAALPAPSPPKPAESEPVFSAPSAEDLNWDDELEHDELAPAPQATPQAPPASPAPVAERPSPELRAPALAPFPGPSPSKDASSADSDREVLVPVSPEGARRQLLSRSTLLILMAMTSVNALIAVVTLMRASEMSDAGQRMIEAAQEMRGPAPVLAEEERSEVIPFAAPSSDAHPTLERAVEEIARGDFESARKRIYALLSVIDRVEDAARHEIEANAQFLLAQAAHLQALESMGGDV